MLEQRFLGILLHLRVAERCVTVGWAGRQTHTALGYSDLSGGPSVVIYILRRVGKTPGRRPPLS